MFVECRDYLMENLEKAGLSGPVATGVGQLEIDPGAFSGAVLPKREAFLRNGSKRKYEDGSTMRGIKRRKAYDRRLGFAVFIGGETQEEADGILERFLLAVGDGLSAGGGFAALEVSRARWLEGEGNPLGTRVAVRLEAAFAGGVYEDTALADISGFALGVRVEKAGAEDEGTQLG